MKKFLKIVYKVFFILILLSIFVIPFLNNFLNKNIAEVIFYFSIGIFIVFTFFEKNSSWKEKIIGLIIIGFIFISIFVINYYHTKYNWLWFAFGCILLLIPGTFFFYDKHINKNIAINEISKKNIKRLAIRYSFLVLIVDLFYMSIFTKKTFFIIIFGVTLIVDDLYNLTKAFLTYKGKYVLLIIIDFVCVIFATICLIFIIPNKDLQDIVITLISAIYGGLLTLVGVAWTIKDNKFQILETKRKENIPYLLLPNDTVKRVTILETQINVENEKIDFEYSLRINTFVVKVSNNCIFEGILFNNKKYEFKQKFFIEKNCFAQVNIIDKYIQCNMEFNASLELLVSDISGNLYKYSCILEVAKAFYGTDGNFPFREAHRDYKIINISMPSIYGNNN